MRSVPGERAYDHVKRAASEGPPNTPKNGNEAAGAQYDVVEHATQLHALLSELPKLDITDKDSKICGELLYTSLARSLTDKYTERGAVRREEEHENANVAATPEDSILPKIGAPQGIPENETEEVTSRYKGDGPSASRLKALLSTLDPLRCSQLADQDSGDSDGSSCTCESTDSTPSPATSLSEHDALYFAFEDMSNAFPATTGMVLIDGQSR
ncbi:hypothetical protein CRV24_010478 [Beauveria bassiana]|nr:hypothetical protein CRV24_010478 [Beauveria bassiana]KAH8715532.1 hypothetical protein HC256_004347 [Beauveria bassiana]